MYRTILKKRYETKTSKQHSVYVTFRSIQKVRISSRNIMRLLINSFVLWINVYYTYTFT